jgi:hypothetical protein
MWNNPDKGTAGAGTTKDFYAESSEFLLAGLHDENDSILLRIAILGDAEPKPLAEFPNMDAAVEQSQYTCTIVASLIL